VIDLIRIPAPYLDGSDGQFVTSEMEKYRWAYQTADGRWLIQRAYGECGGGWHIIDTTGEHRGQSCYGPTDHLATRSTLAQAKAYLSEWAINAIGGAR
jgi:hypothetical protein